MTAGYKVTSGRKRRKFREFDSYFKTDKSTGMSYCHDIPGLFALFNHPYSAEEWRLFIDGSVQSLKAVLVHNGNEQPSIPIVYARNCKETYQSIKTILRLINYCQHNWLLCCDLKIVAILMGLKKNYCKQQCFLCLWEGRETDKHYTDHVWEKREQFKKGEDSVINAPLVPKEKIILPPLHIKLGIVKNFVVALHKRNSRAFHKIQSILPKLSSSKIEHGKKLTEHFLHSVININFHFLNL